jgi:hypothetical protein
MTTGSALPKFPQSVPRRRLIRGFTGSLPLRPARLLAPLHGSDWDAPALGDLYFQAFDGSVFLPVAGYDYNSDWTPLLAGLSPAGMAASLAARSHFGRKAPLFKNPIYTYNQIHAPELGRVTLGSDFTPRPPRAHRPPPFPRRRDLARTTGKIRQTWRA